MNLSYDEIVNPPMRKCLQCNQMRTVYDFKLDRTGRPSSCCRTCIANNKKKQKEQIIAQKKERLSKKAKTKRLLNRINGVPTKINLLNADISGICAMCGEILLFGEYHHILGDQSDFTVMLCSECHSTGSTYINYHCISIGRRIEWGALCYY